jgi:tetratricopeptide (TPR) repeat protein
MNVSIPLSSLSRRAAVTAGFVACLILLVLSIATFLGDAIAKSAAEPSSARLAAELAPSEAEAYFASAAMLDLSMQPDDLPKALKFYETAASLEPNNYFYWLALGKAKERNGDPEAAEKALRYAATLAPNYSEVLWSLGNTLIRNGKDDEGFGQIRKAVEGNAAFAQPAASLAWDLNEGDTGRVEKAVGDSVPVKIALAGMLAKRGRLDEAVRLWRSVPDERRRAAGDVGKSILGELLKQKRFVDAARVQAQLSADPGPDVGRVSNSGFEQEVSLSGGDGFSWNIAGGDRPAVGISVEEKHSGGKSLVMIFDGRAERNFRTVSQVVAVDPGREYRFEAFYRSELNTEKTVHWEIVDISTGAVLASTEPLKASTDWASAETSFSTEGGSEGVIIRLVREKCLAGDCAIEGRLWIDDVTLK